MISLVLGRQKPCCCEGDREDTPEKGPKAEGEPGERDHHLEAHGKL